MARPEEIFDKIRKGEQALDEVVQDLQSEELFIDFKRSSVNGSGRSFAQNDKKTLQKPFLDSGTKREEYRPGG